MVQALSLCERKRFVHRIASVIALVQVARQVVPSSKFGHDCTAGAKLLFRVRNFSSTFVVLPSATIEHTIYGIPCTDNGCIAASKFAAFN
jgi:hypothetical protein